MQLDNMNVNGIYKNGAFGEPNSANGHTRLMESESIDMIPVGHGGYHLQTINTQYV